MATSPLPASYSIVLSKEVQQKLRVELLRLHHLFENSISQARRHAIAQRAMAICDILGSKIGDVQ